MHNPVFLCILELNHCNNFGARPRVALFLFHRCALQVHPHTPKWHLHPMSLNPYEHLESSLHNWLWRSHRMRLGVLGLLALLESLPSCADVQLSLNALLRQPFALTFLAGTSELHSHRTASGQASSHMLGSTYASGGMRQVGRDERTGWVTVRGHIQPNAAILCWTWCSPTFRRYCLFVVVWMHVFVYIGNIVYIYIRRETC